METIHDLRPLDFSYLNQDAKNQFSVFVRCLYKIAEINANLAEATEIYEETRQAIYHNAASSSRTLNDQEMYELGVNQADYFQQKLECQTQKLNYEKQLTAVYSYFFDGDLLYTSFLRRFEEGGYQSLVSEFVNFLAHIGCIEYKYCKEIKELRKDGAVRSLLSRFRTRTNSVFLNQFAYIQDNTLQIYEKNLDKQTFYKITLWMIYEKLEQQGIVQYNYQEDKIFISKPKYRIKEHDFTDEKFFKGHYVNVYGNLENSTIRCEHTIIKVDAYVQDIFYENKTYYIPMDYCTKCKQYFIDPETVDALRVSYHQYPKLRYNPKKGDMYSKNPRSTLSLYGYSVRKDLDLTPTQRRGILDAVIENKILTKFEVIDFIEMNIAMREYQNSQHEAILKWRSDLQYIRNRISF